MTGETPFYYAKRRYTLLNDKAAAAESDAVFVGDCKEVILIIVAENVDVTSPVGTVQVISGYQPVHGNSSTPIVPASAAGKNNQWLYQYTWNISSNAGVAGGTGLSITTAGVYGLVINNNSVEWLAAKLTYTSGKFSVYAYGKP